MAKKNLRPKINKLKLSIYLTKKKRKKTLMIQLRSSSQHIITASPRHPTLATTSFRHTSQWCPLSLLLHTQPRCFAMSLSWANLTLPPASQSNPKPPILIISLSSCCDQLRHPRHIHTLKLKSIDCLLK